MSKQCLHMPQFLVVQPAHLLQEANLCCFSALQTILAFFSRITWEDTSLKPTSAHVSPIILLVSHTAKAFIS